MSKIRILSEQLSNRIAAGEVIERPASVIKELVENAIDAGADRIRVEVERAGTRLIAVSDNGSGMDPEDALLCLEPHGTSKLADDSDIDRICTLGFRGEAIPSIASVSRFSLGTRTAAAAEGTRLSVEGGTLTANEPCGIAPGTTIRVRDLFFNVPARRKFLKSAPTEEHHILEMMTLLMLPRPDIGFELAIDGKIQLNSPASPDPEVRLRTVFGKNYASNLLPVSHREGSIAITGWIGAPGFTRTSRREQRMFVNGRAIESPTLYRGLRDGYATLTEHGRFPPCILFLTIPPEEVDVNVHPAKREVRFRHDFTVSRALETAVSATLRTAETIPAGAPEGDLEYRIPLGGVLENAAVRYTPARFVQPELTTAAPDAPDAPEIPEPVYSEAEEQKVLELIDRPPRRPVSAPAPAPVRGSAPDAGRVPAGRNTAEPAPGGASAPESPSPLVFNGDWPREVLGILDKTYILAASPNGLVVIDQHAAHERVLFERLLAAAQQREHPRQMLLIPCSVELPRPAAGMLLRCRDTFEKLGFDFEPLGGNQVMVNAVPAELNEVGNLAEVLIDTLSELMDNQREKLPNALEYVARAACRAAVKAHDELSVEAARALLEQLTRCRQGTLCPHGRPTMLNIGYSELLRRFGRR